ncbi:CvpA family protein [Thermosulfuriphilus sp.]
MEGAKTFLSGLSWFDYLLLAIFVFFFLKSLFNGFSRELASIVGLILGIFLAGRFHPLVANILSPWITNQPLLKGLSFLTVFIIVYLSIFILGVLLRRTLELIKLSWLDRVLGAALGFIKASLVAAMIIFLVVTFVPQGGHILSKSRLYPYVLKATGIIVFLIPEDLKARFKYQLRHRLTPDPRGSRV